MTKVNKDDTPLLIDVHCYSCKKRMALSNAYQYDGRYYCENDVPYYEQLQELWNVGKEYRGLEKCVICGKRDFSKEDAMQAVIISTGPTRFAHKKCKDNKDVKTVKTD